MNLIHRTLLLGALAAPAFADLNYPNFASTAGLELVGAAGTSGNRLRLVPDLGGVSGATWAATQQNVTAPFVTEFTVRLSGGGAGMALVIQRSSVNALGSGAESLGYGGIPNSIAIELDTFGDLVPQDPSGNHASVHTRGTSPNSSGFQASLGATSLLSDLDDDAVHVIRVEYTPGMLRVLVDGAVATLQLGVDLSTTLDLPSSTAWVGFTAANGGASQNVDVLSWTFDENASTAGSNRAPEAPAIVSPAAGSAPINPLNVQIRTGDFVDADQDDHRCSDFEIWTMLPAERVWRADCADGAALRNARLDDGAFEGSHAGQSTLNPLRSYVLRARYRDDSADALTDWGAWTERLFQTGQADTTYAFAADDIVSTPAPRWGFAAGGTAPVLPPASTSARIVLESAAGAPLLSIARGVSGSNEVTDAAALPQQVDVRLRVVGGAAGLSIPATELTVVDQRCDPLRILIPAVNLAPGESALFWIASDGSTWNATPAQTTPGFTTLARGFASAWDAEEGYDVDIVASGLRLPTNLAFVPNAGDAPGDPYLYVVELYGAIKVVRNDGSIGTFADNLLNYDPNGGFPGSGEQGMGGITVDPLTGDVYASMLYDTGGPHYPKVVRFTSNDGGLTAATETIVLDMPGETQGQAHYIAHLELLADRTMLVHMGDGFNTSTARNLSSFRGKILRMHLDGTAPSDNPLYNGAPITAVDYIYSSGVRNPWGGRFRASDGFHYMVENGPSVDRFARVVAGRDYLWAGTNGQMANFALYNWAPASGPVNMAWIEPETFAGSGFPADKQDHAFVSSAGWTYASGPQSIGKRVEEFVLDGQGNLVSGPTTIVRYVGTGRSTVAGLVAGPDGLYFTDLYRETGGNPTATGASILRVRWSGDTLDECGTLGQTYCGPAVANSTGSPATLQAVGSDRVLDNDLRLDARNLPTNALGYYLASKTQGFVAMPGNSNGNLCLGGTIGRFVQQAQSSGADGEISVAIDLANMPSPLSAVAAGETWNFQAWFRDFQLVPTSNFTDGLSLTFR